jgi:hypothetical protein
MRNEILIDTNIAIYSFQGRKNVNKLINGESLSISFITEIELLSWPDLTNNNYQLVRLFINQCRVIENSARLKEIVIELRKEYKLSVSDSFVSATALMLNIPLISADKTFHKIKEINFFHVTLIFLEND